MLRYTARGMRRTDLHVSVTSDVCNGIHKCPHAVGDRKHVNSIWSVESLFEISVLHIIPVCYHAFVFQFVSSPFCSPHS
jgi:hypothetical protein